MNLFEAKTNFSDAHFWLINKHSIDKIGKPVRKYRDCLIGIKCNEELFLPDYAFYLFQYLYQSNVWQSYAHGTINLVRLNISDVRHVLNNSFLIESQE